MIGWSEGFCAARIRIVPFADVGVVGMPARSCHSADREIAWCLDDGKGASSGLGHVVRL